MILVVFSFEISGKDDNDKQPEKRLLMFVTLLTPFNLISSLSLTFLTSNSLFNSYSLLSYTILQCSLLLLTKPEPNIFIDSSLGLTVYIIVISIIFSSWVIFLFYILNIKYFAK